MAAAESYGPTGGSINDVISAAILKATFYAVRNFRHQLVNYIPSERFLRALKHSGASFCQVFNGLKLIENPIYNMPVDDLGLIDRQRSTVN